MDSDWNNDPVRAAEHCEKAADILERGGWTCGEYEKQDGSCCIAGALSKTYGYLNGDWDCEDEGTDRPIIVKALQKFVNAPDYTIVDINDKVVKSKEQAVDLLRSVAINLKKENDMYPGATVRFRYQGGSYPGMIRVVDVQLVQPTYVEGYDNSLKGRPYRRFSRNRMENVVAVPVGAKV